VTARELAELGEDLPFIQQNIRGMVRLAFRTFADKPPNERVQAVRFFLMKKNQQAAERVADRKLKREREAAERRQRDDAPPPLVKHPAW
jgi:hypothetical protein